MLLCIAHPPPPSSPHTDTCFLTFLHISLGSIVAHTHITTRHVHVLAIVALPCFMPCIEWPSYIYIWHTIDWLYIPGEQMFRMQPPEMMWGTTQHFTLQFHCFDYVPCRPPYKFACMLIYIHSLCNVYGNRPFSFIRADTTLTNPTTHFQAHTHI